MGGLCCAVCSREQSLKTNAEILYCYHLLSSQCEGESVLVHCSGLVENTDFSSR